MYRYGADQLLTYTPQDLILFMESPFASWMERLTIENPDHGIRPDLDAPPAHSEASSTARKDVAQALAAGGREVALINAELEEPLRRSATLAAMRSGANFIVGGRLAVGPLAAPVDLLLRSSGYSDFGNYLYLPCNLQEAKPLHEGVRLCCIADLLHSIQGQLPPQILVIRPDMDVAPLSAEERIHHYRAVKQRFMRTMGAFRKHRMPDPSESAHFGRWNDCAYEVIRQRSLAGGVRREDEVDMAPPVEDPELPAVPERLSQPRPRPVPAAAATATAYDPGDDALSPRDGGGTLAEQAKELAVEITVPAEPAEAPTEMSDWPASASASFVEGDEVKPQPPAASVLPDTPPPAPVMSAPVEQTDHVLPATELPAIQIEVELQGDQPELTQRPVAATVEAGDEQAEEASAGTRPFSSRLITNLEVR